MRIVYCIAATYNSGGMERVLANKANWLVRNGYEVIIVTTDQRGRAPFFKLDNRIKKYDLGINYEENNGSSLLNKIVHYPFKQFRHKHALDKLLKQLNADIVISMFCNDASILPLVEDGSIKLLEIHFSRFKRLQYGRKGVWRLVDVLRSRNDLRVVSKFDRFIVLTEEDKGYWGNLSNILVIPNARTFVFDQPSELTEKTVIAVGRYCYQKALDKLIDAWGIVCREIKDWTLRLVGDGEDREMLEKQIDRLGLTDNVILGKSETDMKSVYVGSSMLVLSSRYEGLPMVLLEAQAAGLPVVSFACKCGPKDVIDDGLDGVLVEDGNIQALAEGILRLIKDPLLRKRMGTAAYQRSDRYSEETIMTKWDHLFKELVR
jgi:glycosyltransferase involved in cell wall biosynthesis